MGRRAAKQICSTWHMRKHPGLRRFLRRQTAKMMRRLGKQLGDDAPKRVPLQGYDD